MQGHETERRVRSIGLANELLRLIIPAKADDVLSDAQELEDHIRALRRYAHALVGGSAHADDIVQETLKRALHYLRDGKEILNLRAYLFTMLHHVHIDHIKREKRAGELLPIDEEMQLAVPPPQLGYLQCREVAAAIRALPDEQREVLLLVALEGMSYQDATEILGVPIGTIMSRLNRARKAVADRLGMDRLGMDRLDGDESPQARGDGAGKTLADSTIATGPPVRRRKTSGSQVEVKARYDTAIVIGGAKTEERR
jgi:RNA polymerase sigma-70 factor (ECF subfamily)